MGPDTGPNLLGLVSGEKPARQYNSELLVKSKSYYTLTLSKLNPMLVPKTSRDSRPALVHEATRHSKEGLGGQSQHPGEESGQTGHDPGHSLAAEAEAGQGQDAGCQKTTLVGHGNLPVCGKPEVRGGTALLHI